MPNLKGMNVEALMSLRDEVDKRLLELRTELEKELAALRPAKGKAISSSLKGRKVPPKYRSPSGRLGPEGEHGLVGWLLRSKVEGNSTIS
jgi:hypothetical protein